ncbi:uncharacterized protein LOC134026627 [Osmerus eperlanus]|uniref:uncharacterized protein LOC134026627 n=1 Tax=Osmerus eperlanus TaxID=29151 RepID=UPI002E143ACA
MSQWVELQLNKSHQSSELLRVPKQFWTESVCQTVEIHQTPSDLLSRDGDTVQLVCTHDQTDYRVMLWYFQKPGDTALTLIGYINYQSPTYEDSYGKYFTMTGDFSGSGTKNGSLSIRSLSLSEDSAVYYCAARQAQYCRSPLFSTKTLLSYRSGLCHRVKHLHLKSELDPATSYQYSQMTSLPVHAPTPQSDAKSSVDPQVSALMVTMIRLLIVFSVPLFWITGVSLSQEVNQTPSTLLGKPEEKIQLSCSHNIPSYYTILWYQRSVGDTALKLIGWSYSSTSPPAPGWG